MLAMIYRFYLIGLAIAALVTVLAILFWLLYRMSRRLDKTKKERQARLYEALLIFLITTPILSFAFMALIVMTSA